MFTICSLKNKCYEIFLFILILFLIVLPIFSKYYAIFIYSLINIIYLLTNFLKIFLFLEGNKIFNLESYYKKDNLKLNDNDLPIYSILLPVRNEKYFILENLLTSIYNLDYPKDKLDIKLIIDEDDLNTINYGKQLLENFNFDLIIVPELDIKSKPISCNYALQYVKGKYLTIYDAEDKPEKYQLKKVVQKFQELDKEYICLQASLNYYNKYDNFLSYCFSIEYSMWFDFTINGIKKYGTFFPLGGTSNHFKTKKLIDLGGWDGLNVTEDAELGLRIVKSGYKVSNINSITNEECPITIHSWLRQRTRWIKGFIQTFCEHTILKEPIIFNTNHKFLAIKHLNLFDILIFLTFIGMSFFFFISIISIFFNEFLIGNLVRSNHFLNIIISINIITLSLMTYGVFLFVTIKNKIKFNLFYFLIFPLYWILHYVSAVRAFYFLIKTPFYWAKTEHGVSKFKKYN